MESFETVETNFKTFLLQQGYPPNLLWLTPDDVVFLGLRYLFWKGDPSERSSRAKSEYDSAMARNVGIALEAHCKTERWALCRVYIPKDDIDAQYRMIPETGVKLWAAVDPKPVVEVQSWIQWRLLKWFVRKAGPSWD